MVVGKCLICPHFDPLGKSSKVAIKSGTPKKGYGISPTGVGVYIYI